MSHRRPLSSLGLTALAGFALASQADAQVFVRTQSALPSFSGGQFAENIDYADVDQDGDLDAAIARGGDFGDLQNLMLINEGGAQSGTLGEFANETASRFPSITDDSRDIEFVDFDGDSDQDLYISNTAQINSQGNLWWTNQGNQQAGTVGVYVDETSTRWVGLGGAGSSIDPSQVLPGNTFIDWSCDCDFGDLDNDGDMDLVHSSYGGAFGGQVPTRLFLNDGDGHFSEFNPNGNQLTGSTITNGELGIWCEGVQTANTTTSDGTRCDIATSTLDIDLGDVDGDFDLDILHGDRERAPRFFKNRLEENGGTLGFRDVTGDVYPGGYQSGDGHYEQEFGDLDNDGDLDIYGLNWDAGGFNFDDVTMRNSGFNGGTFTGLATLPGSGSDDNEGDFIDYDRDGDMDLFVSNFSGTDRLYRNDGVSGGSINYTLLSGGSGGSGLNANGGTNTSLDGDGADLDEDGDTDFITSRDNSQVPNYWRNQLNVVDTHAPYFGAIEGTSNQTAQTNCPPSLPIRAQVYDNEPYYITWYNPTSVDLSVDGINVDTIDAVSSGGNIFRAVLPGNLVGAVEYFWQSSDIYDNTGTSGTESYTSSFGGTVSSLSGTGSGSPVPLPDAKSVGTPGGKLYITLEDATGGELYFMFVSLGTGGPTFFPDGSVNNLSLAGLINPLTKIGLVRADGTVVVAYDVPKDVGTGFSIYWQFHTTPDLVTLESSRALEVPFQ